MTSTYLKISRLGPHPLHITCANALLFLAPKSSLIHRSAYLSTTPIPEAMKINVQLKPTAENQYVLSCRLWILFFYKTFFYKRHPQWHGNHHTSDSKWIEYNNNSKFRLQLLFCFVKKNVQKYSTSDSLMTYDIGYIQGGPKKVSLIIFVITMSIASQLS